VVESVFVCFFLFVLFAFVVFVVERDCPASSLCRLSLTYTKSFWPSRTHEPKGVQEQLQKVARGDESYVRVCAANRRRRARDPLQKRERRCFLVAGTASTRGKKEKEERLGFVFDENRKLTQSGSLVIEIAEREDTGNLLLAGPRQGKVYDE